MPGPAAEVAAGANRAIILPLCTAQLQAQPQARGKVSSAKVADGAHLVGAAKQDLHAQVQFDCAVRARGASGPAHAAWPSRRCGAERAPARTQRAPATPRDG